MKVKLTTPLAAADGSYNAGDEYECASKDEAKRFFQAGMAVPIAGVKTERATQKNAKKESR